MPAPPSAPAISPLVQRPGTNQKKKKSGSFADFSPGYLTAEHDAEAVEYYEQET